MDPERMAIVAATLSIRRLTDEELAAMNIAVQLDMDPREVTGYDKVSGCFTCLTTKGYSPAHDLVKQAFAEEAGRRFYKEGA